MKKIWIVIFIFLTIFFLIRYLVVGQAVYGDGIFYWSYTRSLYVDHDLNFYNELGHKYNPENNNAIREAPLEQYTHGEPTTHNAAPNRYPPGAPLSWLPYFFIADLAQQLLQLLGNEVPRLGYSDIYQVTVGLGNISFIVIGLIFLHLFLRSFFSKKVSLFTTVFILFSTNLFYYGSLDVINSHPLSFMLSSIYFYTWRVTQKDRSLIQWFFLGLILGLITSTRTQDIILGIILLADVIYGIYKKREFFLTAKKIAAMLIGVFLGILPQLFAWAVLYGTYWKSPYVDNVSFQFLNPQILGVLFNNKTGLSYFSPVFILGFIGLVLFWKKNRNVATALTAVVLLQFYLISSWGGWHQGEAYGVRMLLSLAPAFAVGIGYVITHMLRHMHIYVFSAICILFIIYNFTMIAIFQFYIQETTYIFGVSTEKLIIDRITSWF